MGLDFTKHIEKVN